LKNLISETISNYVALCLFTKYLILYMYVDFHPKICFWIPHAWPQKNQDHIEAELAGVDTFFTNRFPSLRTFKTDVTKEVVVFSISNFSLTLFPREGNLFAKKVTSSSNSALTDSKPTFDFFNHAFPLFLYNWACCILHTYVKK